MVDPRLSGGWHPRRVAGARACSARSILKRPGSAMKTGLPSSASMPVYHVLWDTSRHVLWSKYSCDFVVVVLQWFSKPLAMGGVAPHIQIVERVLERKSRAFETLIARATCAYVISRCGLFSR
jgi:hypothetical protein